MGLLDGFMNSGSGLFGQLTPADAQAAQQARDAAYGFQRGTGRRMQSPADRSSIFDSIPWHDLLTFQGPDNTATAAAPVGVNPAYARLADAFGSPSPAAPNMQSQPAAPPPLSPPRTVGPAPSMNSPTIPGPTLDQRAYGSAGPASAPVPPSVVGSSPQVPPQASSAMAQAQPAQFQVPNPLTAIGGYLQGAARAFSPMAYRPQWGVIGTDIAGNQQYGWIDPTNRAINGQPLGSGPGGSPFGGSIGYPRDANGQPLQGEDLLNHLRKTDPTAASMVEAIRRGDASVTGRNLQKYMPIATMVDPTLQQFNYDLRKKTTLDFGAGGKSGNNVKSLETVGGHLQKMLEAYDKINNGQYPGINGVVNWIKTASGSPSVTGFETLANGVSNELGTVFRSSGMSDSEVKSWRDRISASASPEQFNENMRNLLDMLKTRKEALAEQYKNGMGKDINPATFQKLDTAISGIEKRFALPTQPSEQPMTATGPNGQKIILRNGQWVPMR